MFHVTRPTCAPALSRSLGQLALAITLAAGTAAWQTEVVAREKPSFLQAATLVPDMAMAYWGIAISAAGDHRPAFQLRRDTNDGGRAKAAAATKPEAIARTVNGAAIDGQIRAR